MLFAINGIEFIKMRKGRNQDCFFDWKSFDLRLLERHITMKGCRAPYHKHAHPSYPLCRNDTQLKEYAYVYDQVRAEYYPKPCQRITKLDFQTDFKSVSDWGVIILYPEEVKLITQSKEVDGHALLGNIGGYIGLFLGNIKLNVGKE